MVENKLRVRKYYSTHRDEVLARRILVCVKQNGRVPRYRTMVDLRIGLPSVVAAFHEWAQTADEARVEKQRRKVMSRGVMDLIVRAARSDLGSG